MRRSLLPATMTFVMPGSEDLMTTTRSSPDGRAVAPSQLLWHERVATASGQYVQLSIPLLGGHDTDLDRQLADLLDHMWTGTQTASGATITSVSAVVGSQGSRSILILFLSLDRKPTNRRIDDARMARHLRSALSVISDQRRQAA